MSGFRRLLLSAGVIAPVLYLTTVVLGGLATPGYDHVSQPVSALFERGAPQALPVSLAFVGYNLLLLAFAIGLFLTRKESVPAIAAALILANGLVGLVIELAPMDPVGAPATPAGIAHIAMAALLVVTCAGAMGSAAARWWKLWPQMAVTTAVLLVVMLVTGALAAAAANSALPLLGIFQRMTIGSYLLWLLILALMLLAGADRRRLDDRRGPDDDRIPAARFLRNIGATSCRRR